MQRSSHQKQCIKQDRVSGACQALSSPAPSPQSFCQSDLSHPPSPARDGCQWSGLSGQRTFNPLPCHCSMDSRLWWKNSRYTRNCKEPWQDSRKVPRRTSIADRYIQKDINLKSAESTDARAIRGLRISASPCISRIFGYPSNFTAVCKVLKQHRGGGSAFVQARIPNSLDVVESRNGRELLEVKKKRRGISSRSHPLHICPCSGMKLRALYLNGSGVICRSHM